MFGQHKVELFGETLMNFNILLSYKGSAVLTQGPVAPAQVPGPQVPGPHPLVLHFAPTAMCVYICIYIWVCVWFYANPIKDNYSKYLLTLYM